MTQREIILLILKGQNFKDSSKWTFGYLLEKVETPYGWLGTSANVRLRELEREGLIEKRMEGKYIQYRYKSDPTQLSVFTKV